jgi:hypothetical protein
MIVLKEDEDVDLTAAYPSADILEATQVILEEMRQTGATAVLIFLLAVGLLVTAPVAIPLSLLSALPMTIIALLSRLTSQAQYCAFHARTCRGSYALSLWPICLLWEQIDDQVSVCTLSGKESEYNEFLLETIPLLINAVHAIETVPSQESHHVRYSQ